MPESDDKLQERAAKLQERAGKLQEREAKLQEREGKLQEREAMLNAVGWPFAGNMLRPSGFGGFFIAAYITPVGPGTAPTSNVESVEDREFQAIVDRIQQQQQTTTAAKQAPTGGQPPTAKLYKEPAGGKV